MIDLKPLSMYYSEGVGGFPGAARNDLIRGVLILPIRGVDVQNFKINFYEHGSRSRLRVDQDQLLRVAVSIKINFYECAIAGFDASRRRVRTSGARCAH